jgi:hypothetical protein
MSDIPGERHPFLDDLRTDAELISSVIGRDEIKLTTDAVGTFYAEGQPGGRKSPATSPRRQACSKRGRWRVHHSPDDE